MNPSLTFFSYISKNGLITPHLCFRQPLNLIQRDKPRKYSPQYSRVDVDDDDNLMADLSAALHGKWYESVLRVEQFRICQSFLGQHGMYLL